MSVAEWRSQSRRKENRVAATSNENVALGQVRQGDVLLIPVDKVPTESQYVYRIKGAGIILAAGEATGHHHRVRERGAREYRKGKERYLTTGKAGGTITHEEHEPITLPPRSVFRIVQQREYEPVIVADAIRQSERPVYD